MSHLQANKHKEKEPGGAASERRTGEDTVPAGDKLMGGSRGDKAELESEPCWKVLSGGLQDTNY